MYGCPYKLSRCVPPYKTNLQTSGEFENYSLSNISKIFTSANYFTG